MIAHEATENTIRIARTAWLSDGRLGDDVDYIAGPRRQGQRRPAPVVQGRTSQACATKPPKHRQRAAGTAQTASVARDLSAVKHMIRWKFRLHAALPPHPQPCGDRGRRGRVRAGLQRPDGETAPASRSSSKPSVCCSARAPPPISSAPARPSPRSKPSSKTPTDGELIVRREISSQGRSRSFINGALATAAALRDLSARLVELHGQHEHQALLDPLTHLPLLDEYAGLGDARGRRRGRVGDGARAARAARALADGRPREGGAPRSDRVPARRDRKGGAEARRGRGARRDQAGARQRRARSSGCARRATPRSTTATTPCWPASAASGSASASWRRSIRSSRRTLEARDAIKSQLEDLAFFLRSYADGIDASPARLQQVEDRLALLERLKRKYGPTLQDVIEKGDALARERELLTGAGERAEDLDRGARRGDATAYLAVARDLSRARDGGRRASRASSRRCSPSWRWRERDSRCGSTRASCPRRRGASAASTRRSSSSRRTPARTCGRSRASSPAASCRASCWR